MKTSVKWMILFMIVGSCFTSNAQDVRLGVKGGLNYSILTHTDPSLTGFGFHVGGLADLSFSEQLNIRAELLVSNRGIQSKSSYELFGTTTTVQSRATPIFLTIPLLYRYKTSGNLSFFGGPQFGFLLWNKAKVETTVGDNDPTVISISGEDAKGGLNEFAFGVGLGAAYDLNDNLGLELRYVRDFITRSDSENASDFHNGIQLSVAYAF